MKCVSMCIKNGYQKIMEWKLIVMLSTPVVRKVNNTNDKGYVNKKLNEKNEN